MARVLLVEPFYSGSHKSWADQLIQRSSHDITLLTLPGKFWKWRMHGAAITLAGRIEGVFDMILVTDMIDLGLFKSLLPTNYKDLPILLYFHENQIAYPWTINVKDWDRTYAWINYTSALVADQIAFNSAYNRDSFLDALPGFLDALPDFKNIDSVKRITGKSRVLPLGLDLSWKAESNQSSIPNIAPVCLWNHRWEHDKNPELFFESFIKLHKEGIPFRLIILGKAYKEMPDIFKVIQHKLSGQIIHFGYAESQDQYYKLIQQADIIPVTSHHDFFGISVLEGIYAGAKPLLPYRMAYKEHFLSEEIFYKHDDEFLPFLRNALTDNVVKTNKLPKIVEKYDWKAMILQYDDLFSTLCS